jgi:hypothetical protein
VAAGVGVGAANICSGTRVRVRAADICAGLLFISVRFGPVRVQWV